MRPAHVRTGLFYPREFDDWNGSTVWVVGDSHAYYCWDYLSIPGWMIVRYHCGPRLMWTFATRPRDVFDVDAIHAKREDRVIFVFGEIDCRYWAAVHGQRGLAEAYLKSVNLYSVRFMRCRAAVMSVVPPQREPETAFVRGTSAERLAFVLDLNASLKAGCASIGISYLDAYSAYCDDDGFMRADLVGYKGHLGDPGPLQRIVVDMLQG